MPDEEVIELEKETEAEEVVEQIEGESQDEQVTEAEPESEEVEITIEGEEPAQEVKEAEWVNNLRKVHRETERRNRELEEKLKAYEAPKAEVTLGPKPTLESVDFDTDVFEQKLDEWKERKRAIEAQEEAKKTEVQQEQAEYLAKLESYLERKKATKLKDFEDAEEAVKQKFSPIQQSIIVKHAKAPENVVHALYRYENRANKLKAIKDPIAFALAVRDLENEMTATTRAANKPAPETTVRGNTSTAGGSGETLDKLREEAAKTGDVSKLMAFKAKMKKP